MLVCSAAHGAAGSTHEGHGAQHAGGAGDQVAAGNARPAVTRCRRHLLAGIQLSTSCFAVVDTLRAAMMTAATIRIATMTCHSTAAASCRQRQTRACARARAPCGSLAPPQHHWRARVWLPRGGMGLNQPVWRWQPRRMCRCSRPPKHQRRRPRLLLSQRLAACRRRHRGQR